MPTGLAHLIPACTTPLHDGMVIETDTCEVGTPEYKLTAVRLERLS